VIRRRFPLVGLLLTSIAASGWVAQRGYVQGTLVSIAERARDRVLLYQVNTPIMTEDPFLAVTIDVNGIRYDGEFVPAKPTAPLPMVWKTGEAVQVRLQKHFFYLKRPDGGETRFEIVHRVPSNASKESK
jgi:hypothetical protein